MPDKTSATNPQEATVPIRLTPTSGTGSLKVSGDLIELVGEAVTEGFGDTTTGVTGVTLQSSGDVRVRGVRKVLDSDYAGLFRTAGNLTIDAKRIYPTTLTSFELSVEGNGGQLTLEPANGVGSCFRITLGFKSDELETSNTVELRQL